MADRLTGFLRWAKNRGVLVNGIQVGDFPNRGIGIIARRRLEKGETILSVPVTAIRSLHTVPDHVLRKLPPNTPIPCLMALDIALDKSDHFALWKATMPTLADFEIALPFFWHQDLQNLLPKAAKDLLNMQQVTFRRHWDTVTASFPDLRRDEYAHSWFLAGTRSFYFVTTVMEAYPVNDRLGLMPVIDLFNHADTGCDVSFSPESYTVLADRTYRAGEEVCISYGDHSNDFLLVEYGFVLSENRWDAACMDEVVLQRLTTTQAAALKGKGLLGPFILDSDGLPSSKTRSAIATLGYRLRRMHETRDVRAEDDAEVLLRQILSDYQGMARKTLENVRHLDAGQKAQREALEKRLNQIVAIAARTLERSSSSSRQRFLA